MAQSAEAGKVLHAGPASRKEGEGGKKEGWGGESETQYRNINMHLIYFWMRQRLPLRPSGVTFVWETLRNFKAVTWLIHSHKAVCFACSKPLSQLA